jgi:hypothetical protein
VHSRINTIFGRIVGFDSLSMTKTATAEYDPPVAMGSPDNTFGYAPGCVSCTSTAGKYWATVAGPLAAKGGGNAAMSAWCDQQVTSPAGFTSNWAGGYNPATDVPDNCVAGGHNADDHDVTAHDDAQYFEISASAAATGSNLHINLFDPEWINTNSSCKQTGAGTTELNTALQSVFILTGSVAGGPYDPTTDAFCAGDTLTRFEGHEIYNNPDIDPSPLNDPPLFYNPYPDTPAVAISNGGKLSRWREALVDRDGHAMQTTYTLYKPDLTPLTPYDNSTKVCQKSYGGHANVRLAWDNRLLDGVFDYFHQWNELTALANCGFGESTTITANSGPWVLKVTTGAASVGNNSFSIAASTANAIAPDPNISVYAPDRMGVFTNEASTGNFYLGRVTPSTVSRKVRVTFYDIGDNNGAICCEQLVIYPQGSSTVTTPLTCQYTAPSGVNGTGHLSPWKADSDIWGTLSSLPADATYPNGCLISGIQRSSYNGQYVTVEVTIPDDSGYTCTSTDPASCWLLLEFRPPAGGNITDVSTWIARLDGTPVRIVN